MSVTMEDVAAVLDGLKPGSTHTAKALYRRYTERLALAEREPEHPVSFGVALRSYGCERTRMRRRVGGVQREETGWTLPGPSRVDSITAMINSFGTSAIYTEDEIWTRYVRTCGDNRQTPLPRARLMYLLTQGGHPHLTDKRRSCRWLNVPGS